MKKIICVASLLIVAFNSNAQKRVKFSTQNYIGYLIGSSDNDLQLQTINGISFNKWFTGIGTGIDWYYQRSVPVFLSVERGFAVNKTKNIYFSAGLGSNFPWKDKNNYSDVWGWPTDSKMQTGLYLNAGFGYKISVGKQNDAVLLHVGYSNKRYKETVTTIAPCLWGNCPESTESFNYNFRTISVKIGYGF
jgi:hypothetical protein